MTHRSTDIIIRRALDTLALLAVTIVIVWLGYELSGQRSYDMTSRSPIFFTAGAWILAECVLMFLRTEATLWDRFSWALFVARLATANYIGMQALEFGRWAEFPDWYWSVARTLFGTSALFILAIVLREIASSFRRAPRWRKQRTVVAVIAIVVYVGSIVTIW